MAQKTLSFTKRARNPFNTPAWESDYTSSTGSDLLGAEYYAISYKFSSYTGSDVQSVNSIVFNAVLGGDWAQNCTYNLYLYSQDPAGYNQQPTAGLLTSISGTKASGTNAIQWTIPGSYASHSTLYVLIMVDYETGQVTLNHGGCSVVENYTAKATPQTQISFGTISYTDAGMTIPINYGSNYTLTCTITAGNADSPGNNAQLYTGTSSNGVFDVTVDAVTWFDAAEITDSLVLPMQITVTGGNPSPLTGKMRWTENRQAEINKMKPVVSSVTKQIKQATGLPNEYSGTYIAGYSQTNVTATITQPTHAAVSTVKLSSPGSSTITMNKVSGSTNQYAGVSDVLTKDTTFTVTVTDERGLQNTGTVKVTGVVAYVEPSVSIDPDNTYRCDGQGVKTDGGDHYKIRVTPQISNQLPNNEVTELKVGLINVSGESHARYTIPYDGTTSGTLPPASAAATETLPQPKQAYVLIVIIRDKISDQVQRSYTLKGIKRDLVINHEGGYTHLAVGTTPVGKDVEQYKDTIELPLDGLFLVGGIPVQAFNYPYKGTTGQSDNPPFGKDFHNISVDRMGSSNATCIFGFPASQYSSWSNVPEDPLDNLSTPAGIRTLGWIGWREVYFANDSVVLVKIIEISPQAGRVWFCSRHKNSTTHEYTWSRWKYLMPTSV